MKTQLDVIERKIGVLFVVTVINFLGVMMLIDTLLFHKQ